MSTFREHKTIADRAAGDRTRHREKIERAIKDSIKDVVAEESIIGQNGKKKVNSVNAKKTAMLPYEYESIQRQYGNKKYGEYTVEDKKNVINYYKKQKKKGKV